VTSAARPYRRSFCSARELTIPSLWQIFQRDPHFDPRIVRSVASLRPEAKNMELRAVRISELATDMILQEEIRTSLGMLLVGRGQHESYPLIVPLNNFHQHRAIPDKVLALCLTS